MPLMTEPEKPKRKKPKKPPRKPPKRTGKPITVWLPERLRAALDAYVEASRPRTTQTATVEVSLEEFLSQAGFWPWPRPAAEAPVTE